MFQHGIGTAIYRRLEQELVALEAIIAWAFCREDFTVLREFYGKRGFREATWDWESSLELATFDLVKFHSIIDEVTSQGITFTTLAEERNRSGVESLRKLHELTEQVMADAPRRGIFTPRSFEQWKSFEIETPRIVPEGWIIAKDGLRYVGLSNVFKNEEYSRVLSTGDTGVLRECRGRKIATALKIKVGEYAKRAGYDRIETMNSSTNSEMLAINAKLGRFLWKKY